MDSEWNDSQPIYRQLQARVVAMILDGVLREGDPLPSVRTVATESRVTTEHSHPFSTGLDLCLVHNGSLSNHNRLRISLRHHGIEFQTDNDSEVAAGQSTPVDLVPVIRAWGSAGGAITRETLDFLTARLVEGLRQAPPLDGVFLSLHGAAAAEGAEAGGARGRA